MCSQKQISYNEMRLDIFLVAHRGGGKKQSGRHHLPTLKSSLRASQICYYFLQRGLGKKVMRCQSLGGGGGVYALNEFFEKFITFINIFFCN